MLKCLGLCETVSLNTHLNYFIPTTTDDNFMYSTNVYDVAEIPIILKSVFSSAWEYELRYTQQNRLSSSSDNIEK
jgi:hypothetical protein